MSERPDLNKELDGETFRSFYYLKEELVDFCRENNLPVSGGKIELTDRIACFLDTGEVLETSVKRKATTDVSKRCTAKGCAGAVRTLRSKYHNEYLRPRYKGRVIVTDCVKHGI